MSKYGWLKDAWEEGYHNEVIGAMDKMVDQNQELQTEVDRLRSIVASNAEEKIKELIVFAEEHPHLWEYFKATNDDKVNMMIQFLTDGKSLQEPT